MRFLLDTHILLWFLENNPNLSGPIRAVITNPENLVFVSVISAWEISIKQKALKSGLTHDYVTPPSRRPYCDFS